MQGRLIKASLFVLYFRLYKSRNNVELLQIGNGASNKAVEGEDEDDGADDAVDEPHGADVEMGAHLVHKEGDDSPPCQSSGHDKEIAENDVIKLVFWQRETKSSEKRYNQEHDKRVAQGEQETRDHVAPMVVALLDVFPDLAHGVVHNHIAGIDDKDDTANDLQHVDMIGDKVGYQGNAETHQQTIEQIAKRGTYSSEET